MFRNWLILSLRRFRRSTANSLINLFGLTLGLFVFLLIFIYVSHEFSYDNFHANGNRTYRLATENTSDLFLGVGRFGVMPAPLYDVVNNMAGVDQVTRLATWGNVTIESGDETFYETKYYAADHGLVEMLSFQPVAGDLPNALVRPHTAILSEKTALKIFGTNNAVGKTIRLTGFDDAGEYTIEAVFKEFPSNSTFQFNIVLRFFDAITAMQPGDLESWSNSNYNYLVMMKPGADAASLEKQLNDHLYKKYAGTRDEESAKQTRYIAEPLPEVYLGPAVNFDYAPRNDINRLYLLATIACFVLAVAGINYVNLTTARALSRAKEVAVRKVSGAQQTSLAWQFLADSVLLTTMAAVLALAATWWVFPIFRDFLGKSIDTGIFASPAFLGLVVGLAIVVGVFAGAYPAFALSSFRPAAVLKGSFSRSSEGSTLRNILSILQFSISSGLIIAVAVIAQQLSFIENNDPGYQRDHIVSVALNDVTVREKREFFKQELDRNPNIEVTSLATYMPNLVRTSQGRRWVNSSGEYDVSFYTINGDENYLDVFGIQLVDGRNFSPTNPADRNAFLINETAARTYGWEHPVGMTFTGERGGKAGDTVTIIGVVKDLHFESYRAPIEPMRIGYAKNWISLIAIKIKPDHIDETLAFIEKTYNSLATTKVPFTLHFFDEQFTQAYKSDLQLSKLITLFSLIAVFIACLGLYGLSTHSLAQRLKELSIRKILGAELWQIVYLVVSKFMRLILLAFFIACPVAYWVMSQWLDGFVYHTTLGIQPFVLAMVTMVVIGLLTVGVQTLKAALANPSEALRME